MAWFGLVTTATIFLMASVPRTSCNLIPWQTVKCPVVTKSCRPDYADENSLCNAKLCDFTGCHLRVALILPNNTKYIVNAPQALIELKNAEQHARDISLLPNRLNVTYKMYDDKCEQAHATIGTVDAHSQFNAHVIFGPICDYSLASTGRIVKFLGSHGTPLITAGGFSFDFVSNKTSCDKEFFMLINSGIADYQSFSEFFYLILEKYRWKQIALMYEKYDQNEVGGHQSCQLLMKTVIGVVKNEIPDVNYHDGDIWLQMVTYEDYLTKTVGTQFGIIVMCMNHANTRRVLLEAAKLGMTSQGEYVFINFDMYNNGSQPWYDSNDDDDTNERARKAYKSLLTFTPLIEAYVPQAKQSNFSNLTVESMVDNSLRSKAGSAYLDGIYDGFLLYLHAIQKFINIEDWGNLALRGVDVVSSIYGRRFQGKRGPVIMNCNGQRVANYALMQLGIDNKMEVVANYTTLNKEIQFIKEIKWVAGKPPPDTPVCGYDGSKCAVNYQLWIIICIICLFFSLVVFVYGLFKKYKAELELAADNWKIDKYEIDLPPKPRMSVRFTDPNERPNLTQQRNEGRSYDVGQYHMSDVIIKTYCCPRQKIELDRNNRVQLKKMRDLSHQSLVKFYGACLEPDTTSLITEYCQRGSLLDILKYEGLIILDSVFQLSLINDIVLGMDYLHNNAICHGALKSTNCLIDGHFGVKLADFGLEFVRIHRQRGDDETECKKKLWTSPEVLRLETQAPDLSFEKMRRNDIYAFGIILHEIIVRKGTFYLPEFYTAKDRYFHGTSSYY